MFCAIAINCCIGVAQEPVDHEVNAPCYSKSTIDCSDFEYLTLGTLCKDQKCKFFATTSIVDCSEYEENGGTAIGSYLCDGKTESIMTPVSRKECQNETTGDGFARAVAKNRWYCIRDRDCALSCTVSSTDAPGPAVAVSCYAYSFSAEGELVKRTERKNVVIKNAVCNSLGGSGKEPEGEVLMNAYISFYECATVCLVPTQGPGNPLAPPGTPSIDEIGF
jgi:hypothetical protein